MAFCYEPDQAQKFNLAQFVLGIVARFARRHYVARRVTLIGIDPIDAAVAKF
jgi:hypothetical protein